MTTQRINFSINDLNSKLNELYSKGFEDYLNTWERYTVHDDENLNHLILTCTKGHHDGEVADFYYNETDKRCWVEYSKQ